MDEVRHRALNRLGQLLLNLLRHNGGLAAALGVRLVGRLAGLAAGGMDLRGHVSWDSYSNRTEGEKRGNARSRGDAPRGPEVPSLGPCRGPWIGRWRGK